MRSTSVAGSGLAAFFMFGALIASAQGQDTVRKNDSILHVAKGHYGSVQSEVGEEHAAKWAARMDELLNKWLFAYRKMELEAQAKAKEMKKFRRKERGESSTSYKAAKEVWQREKVKLLQVDILDDRVKKAVDSALKREEENAVKKPRLKFTVEMYSDLAKVIRLLGQPSGSNMAGMAYSDGKVVVPTFKVDSRTDQTLTHELWHQFTRFYCSSSLMEKVAGTNSWVIEGLANYYSWKENETGFGMPFMSCATLIQQGKMPSIADTLHNSDNMGNVKNPNAAFTSPLLLHYVATNGLNEADNFIDRLVIASTQGIKGVNPLVEMEDFLYLLGMQRDELPDFEKKFHEWVSKEYFANKVEYDKVLHSWTN